MKDLRFASRLRSQVRSDAIVSAGHYQESLTGQDASRGLAARPVSHRHGIAAPLCTVGGGLNLATQRLGRIVQSLVQQLDIHFLTDSQLQVAWSDRGRGDEEGAAIKSRLADRNNTLCLTIQQVRPLLSLSLRIKISTKPMAVIFSMHTAQILSMRKRVRILLRSTVRISPALKR